MKIKEKKEKSKRRILRVKQYQSILEVVLTKKERITYRFEPTSQIPCDLLEIPF